MSSWQDNLQICLPAVDRGSESDSALTVTQNFANDAESESTTGTDDILILRVQLCIQTAVQSTLRIGDEWRKHSLEVLWPKPYTGVTHMHYDRGVLAGGCDLNALTPSGGDDRLNGVRKNVQKHCV